MKKLLVVLFLFGLVVQGHAIHETDPAEVQITMPGAHSGQLYEYIMQKSPYSGWELWPGKGEMYQGTEPHGSFLTTYVNKTALFGIKDRKGLTDGSIIVKENYSPQKKLTALTVMYKVKGYNPAAGDWFWAKYAPDGKVEAAGKAVVCIECHGSKKENDYIMTGKVK